MFSDVMSEINIIELEPKKEEQKKKSTKPIVMKPKPKEEKVHVPKITNELDVPSELKFGTKIVAIKALSIPARDKSQLLCKKMATSTYMNAYLDHYMLIDQIATLNDHLKFALCYAFHLFETVMTPTNIISQPNNNDS
jgi:hypothetical protein